MPTVRTVTVKASSGDYTSLSSAEAGEQADLVSLDRQTNIECYASANGNDTAQISVNGWTTDATRYVDVYAPVGERHAGSWDTGKFHLTLATTSNGAVLRNFEDHTRFRYLQVRNTQASPPAFRDTIGGDGAITFVDGCIARGGYYGVFNYVHGSTLRNTVAYEAAQAGGYVRAASSTTNTVENCTLVGDVYGLRYDSSGINPTVKNTYVHGGTAGFSGGGQFANKTNCMSSDSTATVATGGSATDCTDSVAHDTSNFTNVTGGSESYLLPSGSALIDAGVDLSGTFTNSVSGTTRPQNSVFDIGADEYAAGAPAGQPTWKRFGGTPFARAGGPSFGSGGRW